MTTNEESAQKPTGTSSDVEFKVTTTYSDGIVKQNMLSSELPPISKKPVPQNPIEAASAAPQVEVETSQDEWRRKQRRRPVIKTSLSGISAELAQLFDKKLVSPHADLHAMDIDHKELAYIVMRVQDNPSIESLDLSHNVISGVGADTIARLILQTKTLHTLNLEGNVIDNTGAKTIAGAVKYNQSLRVLNLASNLVGDAGLDALGDMCKGLRRGPHDGINGLSRMYVRDNEFSHNALMRFNQKILESGNPNLIDIDIATGGAKAFCEANKREAVRLARKIVNSEPLEPDESKRAEKAFSAIMEVASRELKFEPAQLQKLEQAIYAMKIPRGARKSWNASITLAPRAPGTPG